MLCAVTEPDTDRRLLLVHAHPDDESIGTGATMAKYAAEGVRVTLVTCTLGELGEVVPARLAHLAADREDRLGGYRIGELAAACAALDVTDHRFLGGAGRWRDSGMMGVAGNDDPRSFWRADTGEAAAALAAVIREVRPQVLVTYDANGFYGHPDHIQAHRVAWRAFLLAGQPDGPVTVGALPSWQVAKFYATAAPRSAVVAADRAVRERAARDGAPPRGFDLPAPGTDRLFGVPDEQVTTEIDAQPYLATKLAAMAAHATQLTVDGRVFALSDNRAQWVSGVEFYTLLAGPRGPGAGPSARKSTRERDLFA